MEKATFRTLCLGLLLTSSSAFSQNVSDFSGRVLYANDNPMIGVNAYLHEQGGNIIDSAVTDHLGVYQFTNLVPGDYTVSFSTFEAAGGVDLEDPSLLQQYLEGNCTLTPIQELAADVDGSGVIDMNDYNVIWDDYLNQDNSFPVGPWVFETLPFTAPTGSREGFDSRSGSSSGDVNGNLQLDEKSNSIFVDNPLLNLTSNPSDPIEFNLKGGQNLQINGMHLVIKMPDDLNVIDVESPIASAKISLKEGKIKVTWIDMTMSGYEITEGTPLLIIRTKAKRTSRDGESYSLKLSDESHFINMEGNLIPGVNLILPTIKLNIQKELTPSAYPNPFLNYASLDYQLPHDGHVIIALFDQSGRQVQEMENGVLSAGSHQAKIDGSSLLPGIYHYRIRYSGNDLYVNSGTMIKSK